VCGEDAGSWLAHVWKLHEDGTIETNDGHFSVTPDVRASCETEGEIRNRVTGARLVTLGLFAFADKKKRTIAGSTS